jgi:hypothetical protein
MVEAETNLAWIPEREAIDLVARRLRYTEEYARVWIDREEKAGRLKSRRRTVKKWHVSATDRDIDELYVYDLAAMDAAVAERRGGRREEMVGGPGHCVGCARRTT